MCTYIEKIIKKIKSLFKKKSYFITADTAQALQYYKVNISKYKMFEKFEHNIFKRIEKRALLGKNYIDVVIPEWFTKDMEQNLKSIMNSLGYETIEVHSNLIIFTW